MLNRIQRDEGFTLIELLVVILIIAILIAVAAPSFLGQQDKARISSAKQSATVVYKDARAFAVDFDGKYPTGLAADVVGTPADETTAAGRLAADVQASEPQYTVVDTALTATSTDGTVSVAPTADSSDLVISVAKDLKAGKRVIAGTSTNGSALVFAAPVAP